MLWPRSWWWCWWCRFLRLGFHEVRQTAMTCHHDLVQLLSTISQEVPCFAGIRVYMPIRKARAPHEVKVRRIFWKWQRTKKGLKGGHKIFHFGYFCLTWTHALPMYAVISTVSKGVMLRECIYESVFSGRAGGSQHEQFWDAYLVANIIKEMHFALVQEHTSCKTMNNGVSPPFIEEIACGIQVMEISLVFRAAPQVQIGDFKVTPKVA